MSTKGGKRQVKEVAITSIQNGVIRKDTSVMADLDKLDRSDVVASLKQYCGKHPVFVYGAAEFIERLNQIGNVGSWPPGGVTCIQDWAIKSFSLEKGAKLEKVLESMQLQPDDDPEPAMARAHSLANVVQGLMARENLEL
jgi:hypothetical protein